MSQTKTQQTWSLASVELRDAYTDFILSRQAMNAVQTTLDFYRYTAGMFLAWIEERGIISPREVTARYVREYIAELAGCGAADSTVWDYARAITTILRFWHNKGSILEPVKFDLPKIAKKRLPVLDADQLKQIVKACDVRDRAIVLFMADSGSRRAEVVGLNWADVDMQSGLEKVTQGKGRKDRSAVVGATARRALLAYRRTIENHEEQDPLFQAKGGTRFTGSGLLRIFQRLSKRTGIHVTPHALRADMNLLALQSMLGHEDLTMVKHYAQMVGDDLIQEHKKHSPRINRQDRSRN